MTGSYVGDGVTLPTTPEEALDLLSGFIDGASDIEGRGDINVAFDILAKFIRQVHEHGSEDLEWGEPGDCQDRLDNDEDLRAELAREIDISDGIDSAAIEVATRLGLGRHYGEPHCIWCLQAD